MGRVAEGWTLRKTKGREVYHVRFTLAGVRHSVTTGETDRGRAAEAAALIYADALAGRLSGAKPRPGTTSRLPLATHAADWLASLVTTHDKQTRQTYQQYARRWLARWATLADLTTGAAATYARDRLGVVTRSTVQKELSALRGLLLWADEQALLATLPDPPRLPPKATGQRATHRAAGTTPLSPAEVAAMLDSLPEWSSDREDRYPVKAYFEVAAETGLRPATLHGLRAPDHWRPGRTDLTIPAELDKSRWERTVALSARAIAALTHAAPVEGLIFGEHDYRGWLRRAALAAGLPHERASRVVPYDLRHARATSLLAAGASLPGVQYLLGHRLASTTDRYTHPGPDHARAALARVAPPVQPIGPIVGPRGVWGWRCDGPPEPSSPLVFPV